MLVKKANFNQFEKRFRKNLKNHEFRFMNAFSFKIKNQKL